MAGARFAEVHLPSCTIAFGHTQTAQLFNNSARPADNHSVIIEFLVEDVDKEFERLRGLVSEWVQEPTTMPWGNRSILFRDPDGNLVNLFSPVTEDAMKRFLEPGRRPSRRWVGGSGTERTVPSGSSQPKVPLHPPRH